MYGEIFVCCLILGGGEIRNYASVKAEIRGVACVICADSGFSHCAGLGVAPDLLVGDFDSIAELPPDIQTMAFPAEKDYTDSTLAVREAVRRGYKTLVLAGMLGGRFDHSVGNLQNLVWCAQNGISAHITDGETRVWAVADGELTLPPKENAYFSVLSLAGRCGAVTITGGKYPLKDYPLSFDEPRAVSNEYAGVPVTVCVEDGVVTVIETPKDN